MLKGVTFKIQAPSLDGIVLAVVLVLVLVGVVGIVGVVMGCLIKGFKNHCSQARLITFSFLYNISDIHVGGVLPARNTANAEKSVAPDVRMTKR